jgi:deoxycytidine triphosphate deaminase
VNVTPFEPEWEELATLEASHTIPQPAKVHANEGLCQIFVFPLRSGLRGLLERLRGQVSETTGNYASKA